MPGFGFGKTIIAGCAAFSRQCGLDVGTAAIVAHAGDIAPAGLKAAKTGVTVLARQPIRDALATKPGLASRRELGV